jgi:hypothetical protein
MENILEWVTASETNNDFFTLQRSADGFSFTDISTIDGAGNSNQLNNYQFIDQYPPIGVSYYRLKQVDYNGNSSYAPNLVALDVLQKTGFKIHPNPASDDIIITASNYKEEYITLIFKDMVGNSVMKKTMIKLDKNSNSANVNISDLAPGIYMVTFIDKNNNPVSFEKLIKL